MTKHMIVTGTITYAIRGRDILRKHGYSANMEKTKSDSSNGCGYGITVAGNIRDIEMILRKSGVKILEIKDI